MDLLGSGGGGGGDRATVVGVRPFLLHATPMVDVLLRFPDGHRESHRLGAESIDERLAEGDAVAVERVMAMVVGVRRAE